MAQLLVRDITPSLVQKLKRQASAHGVSAEEEHRRILKAALSRPGRARPSLIEFLLSPEAAVHPKVELDTSRSRADEARDTGF
jgi:antitoxin FitA